MYVPRSVPNPPTTHRPRTPLSEAAWELCAAVTIARQKGMEAAASCFDRGLAVLGDVVRSMHPDRELKRCGREIRDAVKHSDLPRAAAAAESLTKRMEEVEAPIIRRTLEGAVIDLRAGINAHQYRLYDFSRECFMRGLVSLADVVVEKYPDDAEIKACGRIIRANWPKMRRDDEAIKVVVGAVERLEKRLGKP